MKLWLFTFIKPERTLVSARVAAPTRENARALLGGLLEDDTQAGEGAIVQFLGAIDSAGPRLVRAVRADGAAWSCCP